MKIKKDSVNATANRIEKNLMIHAEENFDSGKERRKQRKITVLGAGTWGCALARMLALAGHDVTVWSALPQEIDSLNKTRVHPKLPFMKIPETLKFEKDLTTALGVKTTIPEADNVKAIDNAKEIANPAASIGVGAGVDLVIFAVPSVFVRSTAKAALPYLRDGQLVVDIAKGIEADTLLTMSQVIRDAAESSPNRGNIPGKGTKEDFKPRPKPNLRLVALSGPTHAEEVAQDLPTTIVSASEDAAAAREVQDIFMNSCMRVYTNSDVLGIELCGALKNVIALAAGISDGIGYGDNAKAAIITRGMAEIKRLGMKMGCEEATFDGLAGIGDLIVTATSRHSRNNKAGHLIGEGFSPKEAVEMVGMVVEGLNALPAAMKLSGKYGVEMPITAAVDRIVNGGANPKQVVEELMMRDPKAE